MNKSKFYFRLLLSIAAIAFFFGCIVGSSDSGLTQVGGSEAYVVVGTKLIVTSVYYDCNNGTNYTGTPNPTTYHDTSTFSIQGSTMTLLESVDEYSSALYVQRKVIFTRVSGSGGIQGTWQLSGFSYSVVSGTLDTATKHELDDEIAVDQLHLSFGTEQYIFGPDSLTGYADIRQADLFVADWNGDFDPQYKQYSDSAQYNITLQVADKYNVVLKGVVNHETVHLTLAANGDKTYASDSATHATYHYYANQIPTCSGYYSDQPSWYEVFLNANYRSNSGLNKTAATNVGRRKHSPFIVGRP